ncbi:MAG: thymidine kinase [Oscillospiraceae bacterium]
MAKLYFRYGAMNSGKTTSLIQVAFNYEERGMHVLLIKPKIDTKGDNMLVCRIGVKRKVDFLADSSQNIYDYVNAQHEKSAVHCVLTDESQFFSRAQIDELFHVAVELNIPVICYGLRTDFLMNGFEGSVRLLEIAHTVEELKTICECGKKAMINARLVDGKYVFSGAQVAIDKVDRVEYRALCPECYFRIKNKTEGK